MQNNRTITPDAYRVLIIVLWLGIAGAFIRVWGLWDYAFSPDEVMLANVAAADSFSSLWEGIKVQTNGPLMYVVLHLFIMLGKNEMLLRCISLVPGVVLIVIFYLIGEKVSGTVSGITMAFLAAFGCGAIQVSQVVRPYSMLLVFLSGALYFFAACLEKPGKKYFCGYSFCMLLALATHYCAVIPCAAIGCAWLAGAILQKKPSAEYRRIILVHLPPLALFCIFYFYHISHHIGGGGAYGAIKETYLAPLFPQTIPEIMNNTRDFFRYLSLPGSITLLMILSASGAIALWRTSRKQLAAAAVFAFAAAIALTCLKLFPFGGSRHSIYLLPMVCLLAGAAVQYGFDMVRGKCSPVLSDTGGDWRAAYAGGILVSAFIVFTGVLALNLKGYTYSQQYNGRLEFPVTRADYNRIMGYLTHNVNQHSALVTNLQTYHYFAFFNNEEGPDKKTYLTHVALGFLKFAWKGFGGYLVFVWQFNSLEIINAALQALKEHAALTKFSTIYFVNIGWETGFIETVRAANPLYKNVFNKRLLLEGGYLYSLSPQAVLREIDAGRFRNSSAAAPLPGALEK